MPVVAVSNQKGGVGKTTTALDLGAALRAAYVRANMTPTSWRVGATTPIAAR